MSGETDIAQAAMVVERSTPVADPVRRRKAYLYWTLAAGALAILFAAPSFVGYYQIELLSIFVLNCLVVVSYRLTTTTGDWGLHHIIMMGVGGYAAALCSIHFGLPIILTIPIAGVAAGLIAYLIAIPLTRTRGFAFFIASFALGEFIRLSWLAFDTPFGGPRGLTGIPTGSIFGISLADPKVYFYFMLVVVALCIYVMIRINGSLTGQSWIATQKDEPLCQSVGIDVTKARRYALALGGMFVGIAGGLFAHRLGAIDAKNFQLTIMIYLVIWIVVGGARTIWGSILGLVVMTIVYEGTRPFEEWRPLIFGTVLIFSLILLPNGLESLVTKLADSTRQRRVRT
ncbi:MAG: branched-chain amino acid ABC transporter permease [Alphaproteobacteria bacterium]|nr:MAG: branched-chain amino acid ABC transporter permease [Alphaproteobacteria bacterium]